jgi:hypothetical protein
MKNQSCTYSSKPVIYMHTPLHQLANRLQAAECFRRLDKKRVVIKDVDNALHISGDEDTLAFMIQGLQNNALYYTSGCCIQVERTCDKSEDCAEKANRMRSMNIFFSKIPGTAA